MTMDTQGRLYVWDRIVRGTHWLVALMVFSNWFWLESSTHWHRWAGYAACGLVLVRTVWGLAGRGHARFDDWFPTPSRLFPYLRLMLQRREPRMLGHNPAGAVMMLALWALILALGVSGFLMDTDRYFGEEWLEELHELFSEILMGAVSLHVLAALYESQRHHENLVRSMITGYKRGD